MRAAAGGELDVKCSACGVVSKLSASELRPPEEPLRPDEKGVECPKCSHRQRNPESCDRCGLVFALWSPEKAEAPTDEAAEALWGSVEKNWDEERVHRAFVEYCCAIGLYAYAAQQYGRARTVEPRRARAVAEIERLATIAQAALAASQPKTSVAKVRRIKAIMIVLTFVVCAALLLVIARRLL